MKKDIALTPEEIFELTESIRNYVRDRVAERFLDDILKGSSHEEARNLLSIKGFYVGKLDYKKVAETLEPFRHSTESKYMFYYQMIDPPGLGRFSLDKKIEEFVALTLNFYNLKIDNKKYQENLDSLEEEFISLKDEVSNSKSSNSQENHLKGIINNFKKEISKNKRYQKRILETFKQYI